MGTTRARATSVITEERAIQLGNARIRRNADTAMMAGGAPDVRKKSIIAKVSHVQTTRDVKVL